MNPVYSDHEILDRVESDIRTTMEHLKARTLAQFGDLQTVPYRKMLIEETSKDFDYSLSDTLANVVKYTRNAIPEETEFRADMVAHDRQIAKG